MVKLIRQGVYYMEEKIVKEAHAFMTSDKKEAAQSNTIARRILSAHGGEEIAFDALASHDITYVNIIQTARASGMENFPLPYYLTNCHNSLCAVGGTINGDDHAFGLSAAQKYGGDFIPPHLAVIHEYIRERVAKGGGMVLGSDSHTRYGALGAMGIGEGGPELVKQLLAKPYELKRPETVAVYLKGKLRKGVGAQDVALALIRAVYKNNFVKNKILEFIGPGIANLSMDLRNGIDVMTTETACLTSVWETDGKTREYFVLHGREKDFRELHPVQPAYYDSAVVIDLTRIEPMIALPFHPSNAYTIREFLSRPEELLKKLEEEGRRLNPAFTITDRVKDGKVYVSQGVIAGCAGGMYENIAEAAEILRGKCTGSDFELSVYPSSQPVYKGLVEGGYVSSLISAGAVVKTAFCGPCFGAGDVPANNGLSVRHTTRNFENREGSKPSEGQLAAVCLMDARSIAATAANGGVLTSALGLDYNRRLKKYSFDPSVYESRVYHGISAPQKERELVYGPNIKDYPKLSPMADNLLLKVVSVLKDAVTTTDELIPSGETSSYRSDPERLASFALSRKDPGYVGRARQVRAWEEERRAGGIPEEVKKELKGFAPAENTAIGSVVCAVKPGDGSAREQAASCQRILGGMANICTGFATKRYRSNVINWGMLPLTCAKLDFKTGDWVYLEGAREAVSEGRERLSAKVISNGKVREVTFDMGELSPRERHILIKGCLINYYRGEEE